MAKYNINFDQQGAELLSPDKRDSNSLVIIRSLLTSLQWCRDLLFTSYKTGSQAQAFAVGHYKMYDQVIYNKAVYYSLIDLNTDLPTAATWLKIQDNFLGVDERVKFNGQNIVLEYALNQQFGGTFRPPGSSSLSDIYLTNAPFTAAGFRIGQTEVFSTSVGQTISSDQIGLRYSFIQVSNFQINIKSSVFSLTNEPTIRDFVNNYIPISLNFIVTPY